MEIRTAGDKEDPQAKQASAGPDTRRMAMRYRVQRTLETDEASTGERHLELIRSRSLAPGLLVQRELLVVSRADTDGWQTRTYPLAKWRLRTEEPCGLATNRSAR